MCLLNTSPYGSTSSIKGGENHPFPPQFLFKNFFAKQFPHFIQESLCPAHLTFLHEGRQNGNQNITPCCYL